MHRPMVNEIKELQEAWDTLDTCFDRPEKYTAEALDPINKFRNIGYSRMEPSGNFNPC
jgi:hypothetical protein